MKKNSTLRFLAVISIVIFIVLCGCKQKGSRNSTADKPLYENRNERVDVSEDKDTAGYLPSGYYYDRALKTTNAEDEYNDRLDDYLDDPEDELRFDPEIFDFQDE